MNDRLIRGGILDSDRVNSLSWAAECFYRRLQSLVDDYGNYDGRIEVLRADAYKLKLNQVSTSDVAKWLDDSISAGLVSCYEVGGKKFIHLLDFRQRLKKYKRKFPESPEEKRREEEAEGEPEGKKRVAHYADCISLYNKFCLDKLNVPAKMDGQQGNAMKSIIAYLEKIPSVKNEEFTVLEVFEFILNNWGKLNDYLKKKIKLSDINSNLPNILTEIKNPTTNNVKRASTNTVEDIVAASQKVAALRTD